MAEEMTKEEAEEIIGACESFSEVSCTCFRNPPCSVCVDRPSEEDVDKAKEILGV